MKIDIERQAIRDARTVELSEMLSLAKHQYACDALRAPFSRTLQHNERKSLRKRIARINTELSRRRLQAASALGTKRRLVRFARPTATALAKHRVYVIGTEYPLFSAFTESAPHLRTRATKSGKESNPMVLGMLIQRRHLYLNRDGVEHPETWGHLLRKNKIDRVYFDVSLASDDDEIENIVGSLLSVTRKNRALISPVIIGPVKKLTRALAAFCAHNIVHVTPLSFTDYVERLNRHDQTARNSRPPR